MEELQGNERVVADQLQDISTQMEKQEREYPWFDVTLTAIDVKHAIKKVRTNGSGTKASMVTLMPLYKELLKTMADTIERCNETIILAEKGIDLFFENYQICPICKGKQGEGVSGGRPAWEDCSNCNGNGYIEKEGN